MPSKIFRLVDRQMARWFPPGCDIPDGINTEAIRAGLHSFARKVRKEALEEVASLPRYEPELRGTGPDIEAIGGSPDDVFLRRPIEAAMRVVGPTEPGSFVLIQQIRALR